MKNFIVCCSFFAMLMFMGLSNSHAMTFEFDPNDLIELYDAGAPLSGSGADNPRSVQRGKDANGNPAYQSYPGILNWNTAPSTHDSDIETDYLAWRDDNGGYISSFNIWLSNYQYGRGWGEHVVVKTGSPFTATTADGWNVEIAQWNSTGVTDPGYADNYYVSWWTEDSSKVIKKGGTDIGSFSFSANIFDDLTGNGYSADDTPVVYGDDYSVWFGGYVGDDNNNAFLYDDTTPRNDMIMFQGTLDITATPEPTTMLLFGVGLLGIAGVSRRKRA